MSHNFGFAVQAPVGIHEPWREVVVEEGGMEGGRSSLSS